MKYKCITNGFTTIAYKVKNPDELKKIKVEKGEVLECEGEYILKNGFCLCHNKSIFAKRHFCIEE